MKVKIKGLVFVGFAAAVFAQSAFAAITPNATTDPKTVTSKKYVDEKIPRTYAMTYGGTTHEAETTAGAVVLGNGYGEVKFTKLSNSSADVHTTNGQDVVVTGKAVADAMAVTQNLQAENYTQITDIITGEGNDAVVTGHKVVLNSAKIDTDGTDIQASGTTNDGNLVTAGAVKALLDTSISGTEGNTTVPTSLAVQTYAEAAVNKLAEGTLGTTTITQGNATGNDGNTTFPTTRNVYDFVNGAISTAGANYQRKLNSNETALYVGKYDSNDSTWKALEAIDDVHPQAAKEYVTIATGTGGVYQINLLDGMIGYNGTTTTGENAHDSDITSSSDKLATGKAVYEFVTDAISTAGEGYQPIVSSADTVVIGYKPASGTSGWKTLTNGNSYISVGYNTTSGNAEVSLTNIGADSDVYGSSTSNDTKLATTGSVRKLLDTSLSNAANAENDQTVPTSKAVVDYVAGFGIGATLPAECSGATSTHVCALVAYYDTGTSAVKYEWTIMAPTGN